MQIHRTKAEIRDAEWQRILAAFDYKCAYCGDGKRSMIREHMMPRSRGGGDELENIVPSCSTCNGQKTDRTPLEWFLVRLGHWRQHPRTRKLILIELRPGERWAWSAWFSHYVAVVRSDERGCRVRHPFGESRSDERELYDSAFDENPPIPWWSWLASWGATPVARPLPAPVPTPDGAA